MKARWAFSILVICSGLWSNITCQKYLSTRANQNLLEGKGCLIKRKFTFGAKLPSSFAITELLLLIWVSTLSNIRYWYWPGIKSLTLATVVLSGIPVNSLLVIYWFTLLHKHPKLVQLYLCNIHSNQNQVE